MKHYICTGGCEGVSDTPGSCQAEDCEKHEQPLEACNCEDGEHTEHASGSSNAEQEE